MGASAEWDEFVRLLSVSMVGDEVKELRTMSVTKHSKSWVREDALAIRCNVGSVGSRCRGDVRQSWTSTSIDRSSRKKRHI